MKRVCTSCGTKLRNGHGFPSAKGGLFCGRAFVIGTVYDREGNAGLGKKYLGCNKW